MANQWGGGPANYYGTNPYFSGPLRDTGVQMKYSEPTERASNALATGASFLPFVGGMQDASSAYNSYSEGDLLGGLGYTALAGIGALPFGGMLKGVGKGLAKQIPMPGLRAKDVDIYDSTKVIYPGSNSINPQRVGPLNPKYNITPPATVPLNPAQKRALQGKADKITRSNAGFRNEVLDHNAMYDYNPRAGNFDEYVQFDPDNIESDWII